MPVINTKEYKRLTIDKLNMDGCMNLLEAFVLDVSQAFVTAYYKYIEHPQDKKLKEHYDRYRKLILSDYFCRLTNLDGNVIVDTLERRCIEGRYTIG